MPFSRTNLLLGLLCRLICTVKKNDKLKKHYEALKTNNHCTKHAHISHPHAGNYLLCAEGYQQNKLVLTLNTCFKSKVPLSFTKIPARPSRSKII